MKKTLTTILLCIAAMGTMAQGWPANYDGVMLQGFYWDSFSDSRWTKLAAAAPEMEGTFNLLWIPQSANCGGTSMGYDDLYWFSNYDSSFGNREELLALIQTMRQRGIGTIADIVVNHRRNVSNWVDFPAETYKGVTYQLQSTDIVANDDGGATKTWATANGYSLSSNNDSGEGWDGMRDLDHHSANVQNNVKAYLKMLLDDFGYIGFRYDMVKGYSPSFTALYNNHAQPQFSVGECWDSSNTIKNWIDGTKSNGTPTSAAFDFQFRYTVRNAINQNDWTCLGKQNDGSWPLVSSSFQNGSYRQWAVTFVENHDTEMRSAQTQQDPIRRDTLAANAYLLAMPGTPCVFYKHWLAYPDEIRAMTAVRKAVGIHNMSTFFNMASAKGYYAVNVTGTNGNLLAVVGNQIASYAPQASTWTRVLAGYHYAYYLNNNMNTAWVDLPSGYYKNSRTARLYAVTAQTGAQLVYTTDGTTPTANSKKATNGSAIDIPVGTTTLKVALLVGGTVSGMVTRNYNIEEVDPFPVYDITVYVNADAWSTTLSAVNFWTWGGDGTHAPAKSSWPGDAVTAKKTIDGKTWFYKTFRINAADDYVNFVFSTGSGTPQTVNVENINHDAYFEVSAQKSGNNHLVNDLTSTYSSVERLPYSTTATPAPYYTTDGRRLSGKPSQPGVYIHQGRKVVVK